MSHPRRSARMPLTQRDAPLFCPCMPCGFIRDPRHEQEVHPSPALAVLRSAFNSLHERDQLQVKELEEVSVAVREPAVCPDCGVAMKVQKTVCRAGRTLAHGCFQVEETCYVCISGCRKDGEPITARSAQLAELLVLRSMVGYDVMVFVGRQRYVHHQQREEIREQLEAQYGIVLSTRGKSALWPGAFWST
jgi:hypothetical protein